MCANCQKKCSTSWRFCYIAIISSSSDGRVRRTIASEGVDLGIIPSPVKPKTQKLVFRASQVLYLKLSIKETVLVRQLLKPHTVKNSEQVLVSTFQGKTVWVFKNLAE